MGKSGRTDTAISEAPEGLPAGLRVLVVEDEFLVGLVLEEDLRRVGCLVLGPYRRLEAGLDAARREQFDLALLDINLDGEMVYPLADELLARHVPFMFLSGYSKSNIPERFHDRPRMSKPHDFHRLIEQMRQLAAGQG